MFHVKHFIFYIFGRCQFTCQQAGFCIDCHGGDTGWCFKVFSRQPLVNGVHNLAEDWCGQSTPEGVVPQFFRGIVANPYNTYIMFGVACEPGVFVVGGCTGFTGCLVPVYFCTGTGTAGGCIG